MHLNLFIVVALFRYIYMGFSISDSEALINFKKSLMDTSSLESWNPPTLPCGDNDGWIGVMCHNGKITGIHLSDMNLSGYIDVLSLSNISGLRSLSFDNNSFSGPIPNFNRLETLKGVYIAGNRFSGEIHPDYFQNMTFLRKLWLSNNEFSGNIPTSLVKLSHLMELHLENNQFTGKIPSMEQPSLVALNLSNNRLEGEIPPHLKKFPNDSFMGNEDLCGGNIQNQCEEPPMGRQLSKNDHNIAIGLMTLALVILSFMLVAIFVLKKRGDQFHRLEKENQESVEVHVSESSHAKKESELIDKSGADVNNNKSHPTKTAGLVMVNYEKGTFELADLMKGAAESLGNSSLGNTFKVVVRSGVAVVVKRVKGIDIDQQSFDSEMVKRGSLKHHNILTPLAYHYRKQESLFVFEFMPGGNLRNILHGNHGDKSSELEWPHRLKIIHGLARGLSFLLTEFGESDIVHGNLKSSNILLSSDKEPVLTDYGWSVLITREQATQGLFAFKSPEAKQIKQLSVKSDTYCLGIVILEILTRKLPLQYSAGGKDDTDVVELVHSATVEGKESEVLDPHISISTDSIGDMVKLLRVGIACTESNPDLRLGLREAIQKIEQVH